MAHCININSPEYKNLENAVKASIPTDLLKAAIAVWQEKNGLENWPTLQDLSNFVKNVQVQNGGEISYSLDDIAGVNYQDIDFDSIDVDAILTSAGIEEGSSPEKTRRFGVIEKALYHNINQINNRIFRLRDRIRKASPGTVKNNLTKQLVILEEQLEKYQQQKDEFKDVQQIEKLRKYAEQDIERVKEILNQPNISSEDIQEARRLVGLWSSIGDFTPSMAENHPLFTAEELQMDSLKYGFDMEDGTHVKGFAEYKNEIDGLGADIEGIAREEVVRFVRNTLKDQTIDKETVFKVLKDLQLPATYLMSLGRVPDVLAQAIAASFRKIEGESIRETQERIDRLDTLYKKIKNKLANNIELFQQKFKNGQLTGGIVDRIAPEFSEERDDLYLEARADKSGTKWQDYFNWIKQNTIYFDVRKLFDQAGNPILNPEAEAHKEELIKHLGEKGFEVYYDKQRRRIDGYFQAKAAFEAAVEEKKDLSKGQKMIALRNWEAINSPYVALDRILDNKVINVDGKPVKSRNNYNLYVPRKFRTDGSLTGYYDVNYQTIESDADLFAYYEEVVNTLSEVRSYLPEEERRKLQTNSLPYIINSIIGTYNVGGLKLGAAAIGKIVQKLYTQTDQSEIEFGEEDLSTHSINNTARMAFRDRTNKIVNTRLQMQISEYVKQNQSSPTRETVLKWRRAIRDELAKEKSWDINNIMKLYITSAMAYKHKSAASSILNLAQVALLQKGGIKSPGEARSTDIYGEPLTQQSIKNLSELLAYTSDVFYGMPKHAIEGKITQVVVKGYEAEFKKLNDAIKTNQDNYDKGLISETQYSRNKKTFERELKTLQTNISVSSLADGFLKYGQVVGMGYNVIAGVVNLMVGSLENATRSADAELLSPKALSLAYKDVIQIIGNKSTPIGKKAINLNKKLNITKTAQNELYDNTSEFWKKFRAFSPFKITEKTEMVNQLPLAFALMRSKTSYNDKGEEISMWEAFDNDGNVKIGYTLSKEMSNEDAISQYQLQVSELINQTHGNYDISSPILAKKFIMGRLGMQFRTWMPEMAMRRWGAERDDKILGIKTKGRWRSYRAVWEATVDSENPDISYTKLENALYASKMLIRKILFIPQYKYALDPKGNKVSYKEAYDKSGRLKNGYKPIRAFDTRMSELDARNMRANLIEVALLIQMYMTKLLILAVMPDLDDDKKRVAIGMLNIGKRLRSDILMFANPVEYEKLNKNLLPISQYLKHIGSWGYDASKFLVSWDDDSWRDLVKQTGIVTPGFSQARRVITYTDRQFTNN